MTDYNDFFTWDMLHEASGTVGMQVFNPMIKYYRDIIKEGLPASAVLTGKTAPKVGIVGGGMAGLVSAELLSNAGYDVTILEAAERIGGRIHTVTFPNKDSSEAGAMRLLEDYKLVFDYLDKLGLKKHDFINHDSNGQDWVFVNGVKIRRKKYLENPDCLGFKTIGAERGKTADTLWNEALEPLLAMVDQSKGLDTIENWRKVIDRYGKYSVYTYLVEEVRFSQGAIDMIVVMLFLEARMHLSLLQQFVEAVDHRPGAKYFGIDGGSSRLPEALLDALTKPNEDSKSHRIPVKIKFGAFVSDLTQNAAQDKVTVFWHENNAGVPVIDKGNDQIIYPQPKTQKSETFDYSIVTCTPPAIRRFRFTPVLPEDKQKALREINLNASTKIFLQFKEKFWLKDGFAHGSSVTDLPSRAVYYPSTDDSKVVISSYTWAMSARGWDSLTPQQRVDESLNDLCRLHGDCIRELFVCGQSYSWLLDDYSMGEAAMIFPEQLSLQGILARPVGNIYFAGDTLSFKVAWIEGAIESGMRAVLELVGLPPVPPVPS